MICLNMDNSDVVNIVQGDLFVFKNTISLEYQMEN